MLIVVHILRYSNFWKKWESPWFRFLFVVYTIKKAYEYGNNLRILRSGFNIKPDLLYLFIKSSFILYCIRVKLYKSSIHNGQKTRVCTIVAIPECSRGLGCHRCLLYLENWDFPHYWCCPTQGKTTFLWQQAFQSSSDQPGVVESWGQITTGSRGDMSWWW